MKISVLIATKNRPRKIIRCITSILKNSFEDYEVIVLDKSGDNQTHEVVKTFHQGKIYYYHLKKSGKSHALNLGIKKSKGEIITITDDDIIISRNWLKNIAQSFKKNTDCIAIYGRVLPYQSQKHKGLICPLAANQFRRYKKFVTVPAKRHIFNANNLSIKSRYFKNKYKFKEWLGVGSIGKATEDEEMAFRILHSGNFICLDPKITTYHDRWITKHEWETQIRSYEVGFWACFGFYALKGDLIAFKYIIEFLKNNLIFFKKDLIYCIEGFHPKVLAKTIINYIIKLIFFWGRGFLIGFYYSLKE